MIARPSLCPSLLAISLLVTVCCGCAHIPKVDRHFKTNSAYETVRYFRYAVDAGQYEAAYQALSADSQQQVSKLAFEAMLRFVDVPELGGIGLKKLLVKSTIDPRAESAYPGRPNKWITLIWSSEDQFIEYSLMLAPGSSGPWRIDLLSTRGIDLHGAP